MEFREFFVVRYAKTLEVISHLGKMFFSGNSLSVWNEVNLHESSQRARASSGFPRCMGWYFCKLSAAV